MAAVRMEAISLWVIQRVAKMPREHRFTLGDRLVETALDVTTLLTDASFVRDKRALLASAGRGLTRLRLLGRLARELRLLSESQTLHLSKETTEVGKMVGGWLRSLSRPSAAAAS